MADLLITSCFAWLAGMFEGFGMVGWFRVV